MNGVVWKSELTKWNLSGKAINNSKHSVVLNRDASIICTA